jgi:hypothetical protein
MAAAAATSTTAAAAAAAVNVADIQWLDKSYSVQELVNSYADKLPQVVRVVFSGARRVSGMWSTRDVNSTGLIAPMALEVDPASYVMVVYKVVRQDRVDAFNAESKKLVSLPLSCREKFISRKSWFKTAKTLEEIVKKCKLPAIVDHKPSAVSTAAKKRKTDASSINSGNAGRGRGGAVLNLGSSLTLTEVDRQHCHLAVNLVSNGLIDRHTTYVDLNTPTVSVNVADKSDAENVRRMQSLCAKITDTTSQDAENIFEMQLPASGAASSSLSSPPAAAASAAGPSSPDSDVMSADSGYTSHREEQPVNEGQQGQIHGTEPSGQTISGVPLKIQSFIEI